MALTLLQKDALTTSDNFLGRVRQACREIAAYWRDTEEDGSDERNWSSQILDEHRTAQIAADMAGELVTDAAFAGAAQADASDVGDESLKAAVEVYCLKYT